MQGSISLQSDVEQQPLNTKYQRWAIRLTIPQSDRLLSGDYTRNFAISASYCEPTRGNGSRVCCCTRVTPRSYAFIMSGVDCKNTSIPQSGKAELSERVTLRKTFDRRPSILYEIQARKLDLLLKPTICVRCDASQVAKNSDDRLR